MRYKNGWVESLPLTNMRYKNGWVESLVPPPKEQEGFLVVCLAAHVSKG